MRYEIRFTIYKLSRFFVFLCFCVFVFSGAVFAQSQTCYDDGTFGPTCAATVAPAQSPPPATATPIQELPKSGNAGTAAFIFAGGVVFLLLAYKFAYLKL